MSLLGPISKILRDPPPPLAFEVSQAGVAGARTGAKELAFQPLKPGAISVSPLMDNVLMPDEVGAAVRQMAANAPRKRRDAALIIPDYCTRMAVLDFDNFPSDAKEQLSLVRFRMKKSVPYDVEEAALSYWVQPAAGKKYDVVAVAAPLEIISRYEAPFRAAGLTPGLVTPSGLAALSLVNEGGSLILAKLTGKTLTIAVMVSGILKLIRCLELADGSPEEISATLYPTLVYTEDTVGARASKLLLCGFGAIMEQAKTQFHRDLGVEVESLRSPLGPPGENNAGLVGYLHALTAS